MFKRLSTGSAVDAEITPVDGEHPVGFLLSRQPDQTGVGQVNTLVGVATQ
ncbi:MAG: hypothetical protein H6973_11365 [Gammaproteobacteria bacterium]|nr:hypothetical protein [Gammaproteobacteria bacterium]